MLKLFLTDCQNTRALLFYVRKKKKMSRRDMKKNPLPDRYNVPRPGENRSGNEIS